MAAAGCGETDVPPAAARETSRPAGPSGPAGRLLDRPVEHIDVTAFDGSAVVDSCRNAAFQARNLAEASDIFAAMLSDRDCTVILTLAGSLVSAGLKEALLTLVECDMADVIVATGAIVVDQDFFEALGFRHYMAPGSPDAPFASDEELRELGIDRIYDTYIAETDLKRCDEIVAGVFDELDPRPWSSRELVGELGAYLARHYPAARSIVLAAHRKEVPVFVPALSDSSAGFGVVAHRVRSTALGLPHLAFDSGKDFHELAQIKLAAAQTGLLMVGGGVPKNFAQDVVVAARMLAEIAGGEGAGPAPSGVSMHKYAVQLTVADVRDGGLSSSTLREAATWGKVETARERMVFGEATLTLSLLASDAYHRGIWRQREGKRLGALFGADAGQRRTEVPARATGSPRSSDPARPLVPARRSPAGLP